MPDRHARSRGGRLNATRMQAGSRQVGALAEELDETIGRWLPPVLTMVVSAGGSGPNLNPVALRTLAGATASFYCIWRAIGLDLDSRDTADCLRRSPQVKARYGP